MTLDTLKSNLELLSELKFQLPNGEFVASHFHITEIGNTKKNYIDCGGKVRQENKVSLQLWHAEDVDHRLQAEKLRSIIDIAERKINLQNAVVEVEFQGQTIETYNLDFNGIYFLLQAKQTACLAEDACGIPVAKPKLSLSDIQNSSCAPGSGCC